MCPFVICNLHLEPDTVRGSTGCCPGGNPCAYSCLKPCQQRRISAVTQQHHQDIYVNSKAAIHHNKCQKWREAWLHPINTLNSQIFSGRSQVQKTLTDLWRKSLIESWLYFDWSYFEVCIVCFGNSLLVVNQPLRVSHRQDIRQPFRGPDLAAGHSEDVWYWKCVQSLRYFLVKTKKKIDT